jgi:hypothetical protein
MYHRSPVDYSPSSGLVLISSDMHILLSGSLAGSWPDEDDLCITPLAGSIWAHLGWAGAGWGSGF